jgi:hypothetical protein
VDHDRSMNQGPRSTLQARAVVQGPRSIQHTLQGRRVGVRISVRFLIIIAVGECVVWQFSFSVSV